MGDGVKKPEILKKVKKTKNDEIDNKILKGLEAGKTQTEIAEELGLTKQRVSQRIQKMQERGSEISELLKRPRKRKNDEIDNEIVDRLEEGETKTQIATKLGLSRPTISHRIKEMQARGVEIPEVLSKNAKINNKILEGLAKGKTQTQIGEEIGLLQPCISGRIKRMRARGVEIPEKRKKTRTEAHITSEFASITNNEKISDINQTAQDTTAGKETENYLPANSKEETRND